MRPLDRTVWRMYITSMISTDQDLARTLPARWDLVYALEAWLDTMPDSERDALTNDDWQAIVDARTEYMTGVDNT